MRHLKVVVGLGAAVSVADIVGGQLGRAREGLDHGLVQRRPRELAGLEEIVASLGEQLAEVVVIKRLLGPEFDRRREPRQRLDHLAVLGQETGDLVFHDRDFRIEFVRLEQNAHGFACHAHAAQQQAVGDIRGGKVRAFLDEDVVTVDDVLQFAAQARQVEIVAFLVRPGEDVPLARHNLLESLFRHGLGTRRRIGGVQERGGQQGGRHRDGFSENPHALTTRAPPERSRFYAKAAAGGIRSARRQSKTTSQATSIVVRVWLR